MQEDKLRCMMKMLEHRFNSRGTLNFRFQYVLCILVIFRRQCQTRINTKETQRRIVFIKVLLIAITTGLNRTYC